MSRSSQAAGCKLTRQSSGGIGPRSSTSEATEVDGTEDIAAENSESAEETTQEAGFTPGISAERAASFAQQGRCTSVKIKSLGGTKIKLN